ncbi:MAG TPA: ABC transporter substrate-binding protein [Acidimicrobiales bacterium]|nr:ABC transporter substrate-binding protein [Acidimicrobiales bacterium]
MNRRVPTKLVALLTVAVLGVAAVVLARAGGPTAARDASGGGWSAVAERAKGQTVKLWMWGGEDALNRYIDDDVVPAAAAAGVQLVRVPIEDTATALARIATERDAGRTSGGAVDLLWVNGKNFAQGKEAGLWLTGWADRLPNARYLDPTDATLRNDFGVATDGQEAPWSRAAFVFAHDTARLADPPKDFVALAAYVRAHPGRVTYPAPPDFTGSAFVRQAVQALGEGRAFALLAEMRPNLWEAGATYPKDQPELERLFSTGQIDLAMSYNPSFVEAAVERGAFAPSVRPYVFATGTLQNVSFMTIPSNAASPEGAQVVADLLLSPRLQAAKLAKVGIPTVLDIDRIDDDADFSSAAATYRLDRFGSPLEELPAVRVPELDRRWRAEVLR